MSLLLGWISDRYLSQASVHPSAIWVLPSSRWEVNSIDFLGVQPTIISHLVCWLMAKENEMSGSHCLTLGLSELKFSFIRILYTSFPKFVSEPEPYPYYTIPRSGYGPIQCDMVKYGYGLKSVWFGDKFGERGVSFLRILVKENSLTSNLQKISLNSLSLNKRT